MNKKIKIVFIILAVCSLISCVGENKQQHIKDYNVNINEEDDNGKISVWTTYWDVDNLSSEVEFYKNKIYSLNYFAAYFDKDNNIYLPNTVLESKEFVEAKYSNEQWESYITFVNDKIKEDGTSSLKDTELLNELFINDEAIEKHVDEIIQLAIEENFTGIEIDYEAIRGNIDLWQKYFNFISVLYDKAKVNNLSVRVLLEPNTPVETLNFPEGPEYIMMCYNLYGYGTEPGPKANEKFLLDMINKMKKVSNNRGYALSTGGFDFSDSGKVKAVTRQEAEEILSEQGKNQQRDEESQCIVFSYNDKENNQHEIWYADQVTLEYWEKILRDNGEQSISIWRLGSN